MMLQVPIPANTDNLQDNVLALEASPKLWGGQGPEGFARGRKGSGVGLAQQLMPNGSLSWTWAPTYYFLVALAVLGLAVPQMSEQHQPKSHTNERRH
jgi:hypothetical protein